MLGMFIFNLFNGMKFMTRTMPKNFYFYFSLLTKVNFDMMV